MKTGGSNRNTGIYLGWIDDEIRTATGVKSRTERITSNNGIEGLLKKMKGRVKTLNRLTEHSAKLAGVTSLENYEEAAKNEKDYGCKIIMKNYAQEVRAEYS